MGQSRAIVDVPAQNAWVARRLTAAPNVPDYKRYRDTESGISPMAIPGTPGVVYTADGLEHGEGGIPSSQARDHARQLDKRLRKLVEHDYGAMWADVEGEGERAVVTFGSSVSPIREALARLRASGTNVRLLALRLLAPLSQERFDDALAGVSQVLVVEQNHGAQLYRYLRAMIDLPGRAQSFHRPGPLPLRPGELVDAILAWSTR
jgi:2-oxoglutarate ferredoxin oxidoreductase subunit alpha